MRALLWSLTSPAGGGGGMDARPCILAEGPSRVMEGGGGGTRAGSGVGAEFSVNNSNANARSTHFLKLKRLRDHSIAWFNLPCT